MKNVFIFLSVIELTFLFICAKKAGKKKEAYAKTVCLFEWGVFICGFAFLFSMLANRPVTILFFRGLTLALCDWLLILLMSYTEQYTNVFHKENGVVIFMATFSLFDSILLLINPWSKWVFTLNTVSDDTSLYFFSGTSFLYTLHYLYTFLGIFLVLLTFAYLGVNSSRFYRFRYWLFFAVVLIASSSNLLLLFTELNYDFSMIAYGFMAILIYYLSLSYIPNALLENTLSLIIRDLNSGILCYDALGRCIYINELARDAYRDTDVAGDTEDAFRQWMMERKEPHKTFETFNLTLRRKGADCIYEVTYKRILDEKDNLVCDYFILTDRTQEVLSYQKQRYLATHDELTGIYNRSFFFEEVERTLREHPDTIYYMICSNIDDFKLVNRVFGMEKGNEILKKHANILQDSLPESIYGRLQADRFAVCLPKALYREELLLSTVSELQKLMQDSHFFLHVCIGIYEITSPLEEVSFMCDKAFIAAHTLKNNYHACIAYYDKKLLNESLEEKRIVTDFEEAQRDKELCLYLQPQIRKDGTLYGAEALVRWNHKTRGLLSPGQFVDVLEKNSLIYKLDYEMWHFAAARLKYWKSIGRTDLHISVNISAKDFYFLDVYRIFMDLVEEYDISPENLNLEITETALMEQFEKTSSILLALRKHGFRIEIDDFGSGYSSLNMLKDITADVLKIDMAFLHETEHRDRQEKILASIVQLAGNLDMCVITEGIETKEQWQMLADMGSDLFQGYYFSKPISVSDFEQKYQIS